MEVIFDNDNEVIVVLPAAYKEEVKGLCGNYDDFADNDFDVNGMVRTK